MELVTIIIGGAALVVSAGVAWVVDKYEEVKRKNQEIEALTRAIEQYAQTYSFEPSDEILIENCRSYLKKKFGNDIEGEFARYETIQEKKAFAKKFVYELSVCMGVNIDNIIIDDLGLFTYGYAFIENGEMNIYLNEALLISDPSQLVKTVCHELRHCVQLTSLTNNIWGFSPQRVAQWLYSWQNYVDCNSLEAFEAYRKQIIEIDANSFADAVLKF